MAIVMQQNMSVYQVSIDGEDIKLINSVMLEADVSSLDWSVNSQMIRLTLTDFKRYFLVASEEGY